MKIQVRRVYIDDARMLDEATSIDLSDWDSNELVDYLTGLLENTSTRRIIIEEI